MNIFELSKAVTDVLYSSKDEMTPEEFGNYTCGVLDLVCELEDLITNKEPEDEEKSMCSELADKIFKIINSDECKRFLERCTKFDDLFLSHGYKQVGCLEYEKGKNHSQIGIDEVINGSDEEFERSYDFMKGLLENEKV